MIPLPLNAARPPTPPPYQERLYPPDGTDFPAAPPRKKGSPLRHKQYPVKFFDPSLQVLPVRLPRQILISSLHPGLCPGPLALYILQSVKYSSSPSYSPWQWPGVFPCPPQGWGRGCTDGSSCRSYPAPWPIPPLYPPLQNGGCQKLKPFGHFFHALFLSKLPWTHLPFTGYLNLSILLSEQKAKVVVMPVREGERSHDSPRPPCSLNNTHPYRHLLQHIQQNLHRIQTRQHRNPVLAGAPPDRRPILIMNP